MDRYTKNRETISQAEQAELAEKRVFVAGCGGLGGYLIEQLARIGIGHLSLLDNDVFDMTNLNRQLYATPDNLGLSKVQAALARVRLINPEVSVRGLEVTLDQSNAQELVRGHDVVLDAFDSMASRLVLELACEAEGLPLIHGAIGGLAGQFGLILPGERVLHRIYTTGLIGVEHTQGNPAFTPAIVASYQVALAIQYLLGKPVASNTLHYLDLSTLELETIHFD